MPILKSKTKHHQASVLFHSSSLAELLEWPYFRFILCLFSVFLQKRAVHSLGHRVQNASLKSSLDGPASF